MHRPLAAETERVTQLVCDAGQSLVDLRGALVPARHRRDHEGRTELLAQEPDARVDRIAVGFGERLMNEPNASKCVVRFWKATSSVAHRSRWSAFLVLMSGFIASLAPPRPAVYVARG